MPVNSRYSRPFTTTPRMPSAIAAITSSRRTTTIQSSAQPSCPPSVPGSRRTLLCSSLLVRLASGQLLGRRSYPNGTNFVLRTHGCGVARQQVAPQGTRSVTDQALAYASRIFNRQRRDARQWRRRITHPRYRPAQEPVLARPRS